MGAGSEEGYMRGETERGRKARPVCRVSLYRSLYCLGGFSYVGGLLGHGHTVVDTQGRP